MKTSKGGKDLFLGTEYQMINHYERIITNSGLPLSLLSFSANFYSSQLPLTSFHKKQYQSSFSASSFLCFWNHFLLGEVGAKLNYLNHHLRVFRYQQATEMGESKASWAEPT